MAFREFFFKLTSFPAVRAEEEAEEEEIVDHQAVLRVIFLHYFMNFS